jgi:hypothetical protein
VKKLTNKLSLPNVFVRAIGKSSGKYTRGNSDISVTQLISPAYQRNLIETSDSVEDVSDMIWSLLGTAVHYIIENASIDDDISEERFFHTVGDKVVSGQCDLISDGTLYDFKVTSVWSLMDGGKIEWEQQLNLLRFLASIKAVSSGDSRYLVNKLAIVAILRDFQKVKAGIDGYPKSAVAIVDIPLWPLMQAGSYLADRVEAHFQSDPPPCTDEERWATEEVYALMKDGRKSAVKLHDTRESAEAAAAEKGKGHFVQLRPKTYRRCEGYCGVSHSCPVFNSNASGPF